jgi:peptidoglycan-associated lipoprotein
MRTLLFVPLAATLVWVHGSAQATTQATAPSPSEPTAVATTPENPCESVRIHFAFDKSKLTDDSRAALDRAASCLQQHPQAKVSIQGNADERGSIDYNQRLGERRAQAVQSYLTSQGVQAGQLETISFGKTNPLCDQADLKCWQRNRRAAIEPYCRM